jgi:hypothetical protein
LTSSTPRQRTNFPARLLGNAQSLGRAIGRPPGPNWPFPIRWPRHCGCSSRAGRCVHSHEPGPVDVEMEPDRSIGGFQTMTRNVRFESQERLACAQPSRVSSYGSFIRLVVDVTMVHERGKKVVGVGSEAIAAGRAVWSRVRTARFTPLGTLA